MRRVFGVISGLVVILLVLGSHLDSRISNVSSNLDDSLILCWCMFLHVSFVTCDTVHLLT